MDKQTVADTALRTTDSTIVIGVDLIGQHTDEDTEIT
jgi:hypothetical protein